MQKSDKPIRRPLATGAVTHDELVDVLGLAAADASSIDIRVAWRDEHTSRIAKIADLAPIEDAANIRSVFAMFVYEDRSEFALAIWEHEWETNARGQIARARQSAVEQRWGALPNRSNLTPTQATWAVYAAGVLHLVSLVATATVLFANDIQRTTPLVIAVLASVMLTLALVLFLWSSRAPASQRRPVVLNRKTRLDWPKIVSTATGVAGFVLAVVAYAYPRK